MCLRKADLSVGESGAQVPQGWEGALDFPRSLVCPAKGPQALVLYVSPFTNGLNDGLT